MNAGDGSRGTDDEEIEQRAVTCVRGAGEKGQGHTRCVSDGCGLILRVFDGGAARWVLRVSVGGKRRDLGLGSVHDISLADARDTAHEKRREAKRGKDPGARAKALSFKAAAERVHELRKATWRNGKHQDQWISTLTTYVFPKLGNKLVADIDPADVLAVLTPIWLAKSETARRVRQRIEVVLDWATTAGYRSALAVNAAHAVKAALPKQKKRQKHHPALPWRVIPEFLERVRECKSQEGPSWRWSS